MPARDNKFKDAVWITTYTRRRFHLYGDDPLEISLTDIAHALSNQCRFTGHTIRFYSVAQHSVLVSELVARLGGTCTEQRVALLHDASEAYLADMAAPFKGHIGGYYEIEEMLEDRILAKYGLSDSITPLIKLCDWYALFIEAESNVSADSRGWVGWDEYGEKALALGVEVIPQLPAAAKEMFFDRARYLALAE